MFKHPTILYRVRHLDVPDWYIAQRAGSFGRIGTKSEAMQQTQQWWEENLSTGWQKYFMLEKV
jgi:hypothetical protein